MSQEIKQNVGDVLKSDTASTSVKPAPAGTWTLWLERGERFSKIFSYLVIPIVLAIFSYRIQDSLSVRSVSKEYVALAISILATPESEQDPSLRSWAVELLNANSPVKFDKPTAEKLSRGELRISYELPSVELFAEPTTVKSGEATTLRWNAPGATSCRASGSWSGNKQISGTQTITSLTSLSTYILTCESPSGTTTGMVSVNVVYPLPTVEFFVEPTTVKSGEATTLRWNAPGATSCRASGSWSGNKRTSGTQTITSLTNSSTYTLTCESAGGSTMGTVSVEVK